MNIGLEELKRILKPDGAVYLHGDDTAVHWLTTIMDAIFGREAFRNEVVWKRVSNHNDAGRFGSRTWFTVLDLPRRTDLGELPRYTAHKTRLYGEQGGHCGGCRGHYQKKDLTVDHIVPRSRGRHRPQVEPVVTLRPPPFGEGRQVASPSSSGTA